MSDYLSLDQRKFYIALRCINIFFDNFTITKIVEEDNHILMISGNNEPPYIIIKLPFIEGYMNTNYFVKMKDKAFQYLPLAKTFDINFSNDTNVSRIKTFIDAIEINDTVQTQPIDDVETNNTDFIFSNIFGEIDTKVFNTWVNRTKYTNSAEHIGIEISKSQMIFYTISIDNIENTKLKIGLNQPTNVRRIKTSVGRSVLEKLKTLSSFCIVSENKKTKKLFSKFKITLLHDDEERISGLGISSDNEDLDIKLILPVIVNDINDLPSLVYESDQDS